MSTPNHSQFAQLFAQNQHRVFRFILTLLPNYTEAEELFQQTTVTLWERWDHYDSSRDFTRWANGIAFNHVRNYLRSLSRQGQIVRLDENVMTKVAQVIQGRDDDKSRLRALDHCLGKLQANQKDLVEKYYSGGKTVEQLADSYKRTPNVIYKTLAKIRRLLRDCITRAIVTGDSA